MHLNMTRLLAMMACCTIATAHAAAAPAAPVEQSSTTIIAPGSTILVPGRGAAFAVKNAPYSAEIVKERQQILGDGNQIVQRNLVKAYRDSEGRTREESLDDTGHAHTVVIRDVAAGVQWILSPRTHTATKMPLPGFNLYRKITTPDDGKVRVLERRSGANGTEQIVMKRVPPAEGREGGQDTPSRVTITIPRHPHPAEGVVPPPLDPLITGTLGDRKWAGKAIRRDLGTRDIDGVKATGQLRSYEIPAGEVGNRLPIVVSDETWYAPELSITLLSKHSDPRFGDSLFRVENVKREEPAAGLFAPPADYTVTDSKVQLQRLLDQKSN